MKNVKKITVIAVLIALCVLGALIKIPSPVATVAFDSLPGFVAAGLLTPVLGGVVGSIGHLISAIFSGFPLGVLSHVVIMCTMFITMFVYGLFYKKEKKIFAVIVGTLFNGPIGLIPFMFIINTGFYMAMVLPLTIAGFINILLATLILPRLKKVTEKLLK